MTKAPTRDEIIATHAALKSLVVETPVVDGSSLMTSLTDKPSKLTVKLELFQRTSSFKLRGALNIIRSLDKTQLSRGVTAFSGGNHAIAVAYAAKLFGVSAKVVMPKAANPARIQACKSLGAEVFLVESRTDAPELAGRFEREEGRFLIPPFEHPLTVLGTASLGYEFLSQCGDLDIVLVPIGGGGLAAGVACAIKEFKPACKVIGVQPKGADAMYRSFRSGSPESNVSAETIADSLCPPQVGQTTLAMCKKYLDDIWLVEEVDIKSAMSAYFDSFRLVVEGAGAVSLASLFSQHSSGLVGRNIGVVLSGSNIDVESFIVASKN